MDINDRKALIKKLRIKAQDLRTVFLPNILYKMLDLWEGFSDEFYSLPGGGQKN
jgi:hypothetical protein